MDINAKVDNKINEALSLLNSIAPQITNSNMTILNNYLKSIIVKGHKTTVEQFERRYTFTNVDNTIFSNINYPQYEGKQTLIQLLLGINKEIEHNLAIATTECKRLAEEYNLNINIPQYNPRELDSLTILKFKNFFL